MTFKAEDQTNSSTVTVRSDLPRENVRQRRISVLHIVLSTVTGGMENVIYNLASGMDYSRYEVKIGCLLEVGYLSDKLKKFGVESYLIPKMIPGVSMIYPRNLIKFIRESGCDIVHTHSGCWGKAAAACVHLPNVKLIYTEHGRTFPDPKIGIIIDRLASRLTNKVIAVGDNLRDYLVNTVGVREDKTITIFNGIDTDRFKPAVERLSVRKEFGCVDGDVVIGIVARLAKVKNHNYLIDAFKILSERKLPVKLLIIGDGPLRTDLEMRVKSYGLKDRVMFAGDRDDVPLLLNAVDVATLSSLSEGTSLTLLEAMSSGLPVVATAVGGNKTIINDGENGFLVDINDVNSYADKLEKLVKYPQLRAEIGGKARSDIIARWSLKRMVDGYQKLYEEIIKQKNP